MELEELYRTKGELITRLQIMEQQLNAINTEIIEKLTKQEVKPNVSATTTNAAI
jgi:hypothetical protein